MQLTNVLTFLTFTGYATAECFDSGVDWDDKTFALNSALSTCHMQLTGTYGPESSFSGQKASCANGKPGSNIKYDFIIKHIKGGEKALGPGECFEDLRKEIEGCKKGGRSSYENWQYKADPNEGSCN
ncbi:hypothetical protein B0H67DRAFT_646166 [Lasiosphaeris hirsuta]|uniref:Uncharacterized protein n=1 Tax=Lasiosphaeris hirsuta TaxID=260670 RepID=A0AA40DSW0_9PEZI|nr:hypothetical protein B0H67DRAFT_646166 [Lasiosphaeris hirsuta]